jgi:hypothetical protein
MTAADNASRWRRRGLALGASLCLHALLSSLAWHSPAPETGSVPLLDTRVAESDTACTLDIIEPAGRPAVTLPVAFVAAPKPPEANPSSPKLESAPVVAAARAQPRPAAPISALESSGAGAGATGSRPAGRPGPPSFFQIPFQGQSVVYVIDRSSSMGEQGRLARARAELLASLAQLPESARFQILVYNRQTEPLRCSGSAGLLPATAANKERAAAFLHGLLAEGSTDHLPALRSALVLEPEVIYFLTDADDLKAEQVRLITQINHGRSIIHTIELNPARRDAAEMPLPNLARLNRGTYTTAAQRSP